VPEGYDSSITNHSADNSSAAFRNSKQHAPHARPFYVVTPIYNPHLFRSRIRLYRDFAKHMADTGATLFTVEAAFGDHPHEVTEPDNPLNLQLRTSAVLWHKERMINLGINRIRALDPSAKSVAWIDADVTFTNPNWVDEARHKLMHHPVIQPYATAASLNAQEDVMWTCPSSFRAFIVERGYHQTPPLPISKIFKGHPGLAAAATMEALDHLGGLYDTCMSGSGDTVMSNCLKGQWDAYLPGPATPAMAAQMKRWAARCDAHIKSKVGYVNGTCIHHWHGKSEERGYEKRWDITAYHEFNPEEDLIVDSQGLYRWAGNKPRLEDDMRLSLGSRNEDA
jgi:hypothetical protein